MLGDLGADVIKVERPVGGDDSRQYGTPTFDADGQKTAESSFYIATNRNKRSITVDFSKPAGQELIRQLAAQCDILIENFKVGTLKRQGLDYESLKEINPRLIYCSVTGYGQTGPYAPRPGYDAVFQAQGGLMSATGRRDGEPGAGPIKVGPSIVDILTGYNAAIAILAALHKRDVTGRGEYIDLALLDVTVAAMSHFTSAYLLSGVIPQRIDDAGNGGGPAQIIKCRDGKMAYVNCGNNAQFKRFMEILGRPQLSDDPMYRDYATRGENWRPLRAIINELVLAFDRDELESKLCAAGVPCGAVNDIGETFADPQVQHRGLSVRMDHPLLGEIHVAANPIRMAESKLRYDRPPPLLGQHTQEVLSELLGLDAHAIAALRRECVI